MRGVHTKDPRASFTRRQERVASMDVFNERIPTAGSSVSFTADAFREALILTEGPVT